MELNGLILESKYGEYQFLVKGPLQKVWRDGFPVDEQKVLRLDFERYICFVDDMSQEQEWTDDDQAAVSRTLDQMFSSPKYRDMWVHETPKARKPWPTYDDTHPKQIHTVAAAVGMVAEALAYENTRDGGPRPDVVKNLTSVLPDEPEPELVAVPIGAEETEPDDLFAA